MAEKQFLNEQFTVIRKPLDPGTGQPLEECRYALFPGMALAQSEPELVVLLYDSILHQYPDTAMFLCRGREGADPLLNRKYSERLLTRWRNLGKPTVIVATPEDMKFFRGITTEIPTVSLYDELLAHNISGGCSRELYRISEPAPFGFESAIRELAENMGTVLYEPGTAADKHTVKSDAGAEAVAVGAEAVAAGTEAVAVGTEAVAAGAKAVAVGAESTGSHAKQARIDPADASKIPFLTSSIDVRNAMKKQGFEAVHILELIYGMGRSNQHLAHTHGEDHDHDSPPQVRDTRMDAAEKTALEELFSPAARKRNLQELHNTLLAMFWNETV